MASEDRPCMKEQHPHADSPTTALANMNPNDQPAEASNSRKRKAPDDQFVAVEKKCDINANKTDHQETDYAESDVNHKDFDLNMAATDQHSDSTSRPDIDLNVMPNVEAEGDTEPRPEREADNDWAIRKVLEKSDIDLNVMPNVEAEGDMEPRLEGEADNDWEIRKVLKKSDCNGSARFLIGQLDAESHILPHLPDFDHADGTELAVWDVDTLSSHSSCSGDVDY